MKHVCSRLKYARGLAVYAALGAFAVFAMAAPICGSPTPQPTPVPATTPIAVDAAPATSSADATATAAFDAHNQKLANVHQPTLARGIDPLRPYADITYPPENTATPGASPTPATPSCGATIAGWPEILVQYGGFYKGNRCGVHGSQLFITTAGATYGAPGAFATYQCQPADATCLRGDAPSAPDAQWSVYPAPFNAGVQILDTSPADPNIVLVPHQYCFNFATHTYLLPGCFPG